MKPNKSFMILALVIFTLFAPCSGSKAEKNLIFNNNNFTDTNRKVYRRQLIDEMIGKYYKADTFQKMQSYMTEKAQELHCSKPERGPDSLIKDTFNKTENLFESTKRFVGNSLVKSYEPANFEKSVKKYLWLKGIGFLVLGIGEEHKLAISYFYQPGNEREKNEFLQGLIQYSFPEVSAVPQNEEWFTGMAGVMNRLGYDLFSLDKFGITID